MKAFILITTFFFISIGMTLGQTTASKEQDHSVKIRAGLSHGLLQSPINVSTVKCEEGHHQIQLHYESSHEHIVHQQSKVELDYDDGSYVVFDGKQYDFKQFHFHTPSEHLLDGVHYPLEMHLVHLEEFVQGVPHYLVIAILFKEGEKDEFLSHFLSEVPEDFTEVDFHDKFININEEIWPEELNDYFYYKGSLTTPPYTETVSWLILNHIHEASPEQIQRLLKLEGDNHRKLQELHNRNVEIIHESDEG